MWHLGLTSAVTTRSEVTPPTLRFTPSTTTRLHTETLPPRAKCTARADGCQLPEPCCSPADGGDAPHSTTQHTHTPQCSNSSTCCPPSAHVHSAHAFLACPFLGPCLLSPRLPAAAPDHTAHTRAQPATDERRRERSALPSRSGLSSVLRVAPCSRARPRFNPNDPVHTHGSWRVLATAERGWRRGGIRPHTACRRSLARSGGRPARSRVPQQRWRGGALPYVRARARARACGAPPVLVRTRAHAPLHAPLRHRLQGAAPGRRLQGARR